MLFNYNIYLSIYLFTFVSSSTFVPVLDARARVCVCCVVCVCVRVFVCVVI